MIDQNSGSSKADETLQKLLEEQQRANSLHRANLWMQLAVTAPKWVPGLFALILIYMVFG